MEQSNNIGYRFQFGGILWTMIDILPLPYVIKSFIWYTLCGDLLHYFDSTANGVQSLLKPVYDVFGLYIHPNNLVGVDSNQNFGFFDLIGQLFVSPTSLLKWTYLHSFTLGGNIISSIIRMVTTSFLSDAINSKMNYYLNQYIKYYRMKNETEGKLKRYFIISSSLTGVGVLGFTKFIINLLDGATTIWSKSAYYLSFITTVGIGLSVSLNIYSQFQNTISFLPKFSQTTLDDIEQGLNSTELIGYALLYVSVSIGTKALRKLFKNSKSIFFIDSIVNNTIPVISKFFRGHTVNALTKVYMKALYNNITARTDEETKKILEFIENNKFDLNDLIIKQYNENKNNSKLIKKHEENEIIDVSKLTNKSEIQEQLSDKIYQIMIDLRNVNNKLQVTDSSYGKHVIAAISASQTYDRAANIFSALLYNAIFNYFILNTFQTTYPDYFGNSVTNVPSQNSTTTPMNDVNITKSDNNNNNNNNLQQETTQVTKISYLNKSQYLRANRNKIKSLISDDVQSFLTEVNPTVYNALATDQQIYNSVLNYATSKSKYNIIIQQFNENPKLIPHISPDAIPKEYNLIPFKEALTHYIEILESQKD